jgi:hypothetical protein
MRKITELCKDRTVFDQDVIFLSKALNRANRDALIRAATFAVARLITHPDESGKLNTSIKWHLLAERAQSIFPDCFAKGKADSYVHVIQRYLHGVHTTSEPKITSDGVRHGIRSQLMILILDYREKNPTFSKNPVAVSNPELLELCNAVSRYLNDHDEDVLESDKSTIRRLLTDSQSGELARCFFGRGAKYGIDTPDIAYYAMYRYSTKKGEIVKTVLEILTPATSHESWYTFSCAYPLYDKQWWRLSTGGVVLYKENIHFIGQSFNQEDGQDESGIEGMKLISLRRDDVLLPVDLTAGVFLGHSLIGCPIVGRIALVRLGLRSAGILPRWIKTGKDDHRASHDNKRLKQAYGEPAHADIRLGILLNEDEFTKDLQAMEETFKKPWSTNITDLAKDILLRIDNVPFVDKRENADVRPLKRSICPENMADPPK